MQCIAIELINILKLDLNIHNYAVDCNRIGQLLLKLDLNIHNYAVYCNRIGQ